ncbi:hypothetical protein OTU49_000798, partial [Cherax quadricarinatus]
QPSQHQEVHHRVSLSLESVISSTPTNKSYCFSDTMKSWLVPALVFLIMVATVTSQFQASKHDISKICKRMRINCSFRIPHICCVFGRSPQVTYGKSSASQR